MTQPYVAQAFLCEKQQRSGKILNPSSEQRLCVNQVKCLERYQEGVAGGGATANDKGGGDHDGHYFS